MNGDLRPVIGSPIVYSSSCSAAKYDRMRRVCTCHSWHICRVNEGADRFTVFCVDVYTLMVFLPPAHVADSEEWVDVGITRPCCLEYRYVGARIVIMLDGNVRLEAA